MSISSLSEPRNAAPGPRRRAPSFSMTPEQIASGDRMVAQFQPLPVNLKE
jgi:hypothetical protein